MLLQKKTLKGQKSKRATDADEQVVALKAELSEAMDAQARLVDILAQSEADATKA